MPSPVLYLEIFIIPCIQSSICSLCPICKIVLCQDYILLNNQFSLISVLGESSDGTLQFWYIKRSVLYSLLQIPKKSLKQILKKYPIHKVFSKLLLQKKLLYWYFVLDNAMQFYRDHLDKKGWFQVHNRDKNSQKAVYTEKMPY